MSAVPHETCWTMLRAATAGDANAKSIFARSYTAPIRTEPDTNFGSESFLDVSAEHGLLPRVSHED